MRHVTDLLRPLSHLGRGSDLEAPRSWGEGGAMARWPISPAAGRPSPSPRGDRSWARDLCGHPMSPRGPVPDAMPTSSCGPPAATIHENWTSQLYTAFLSSWLAPAGSRGMQSFDISELAGPPDLKLLQADWAQGQRRRGARLDGAGGGRRS